MVWAQEYRNIARQPRSHPGRVPQLLPESCHHSRGDTRNVWVTGAEPGCCKGKEPPDMVLSMGTGACSCTSQMVLATLSPTQQEGIPTPHTPSGSKPGTKGSGSAKSPCSSSPASSPRCTGPVPAPRHPAQLHTQVPGQSSPALESGGSRLLPPCRGSPSLQLRGGLILGGAGPAAGRRGGSRPHCTSHCLPTATQDEPEDTGSRGSPSQPCLCPQTHARSRHTPSRPCPASATLLRPS